MDRKLIQKYGSDILSYRLQTARRKTRMQYEDLDKKLIRLDREYSELWHRRNHLGYEPLIPPVQKGWKRFFVLREDVAQSKQAELFEGILKKINTYDWSHRRNFLVKRRYRGRKFYIVKPQKLKEPYTWEFDRIGFNEMERRFFYTVEYFKNNQLQATKYVFSEPWRFTLQVRPNIIDKVRIRNHDLEARMQHLDDYFERNNLKGRRDKLVYGKSRVWKGKGERYDERDPLKNKPLKRVLDELSLEQ